MAGKSAPKVQSNDGAREAEAAKTMRLRALRLAKEAADNDLALRDALAKANAVTPRRRGRTTTAAQSDVVN
jgi:hypothetical protein